MRRKKQMIDVPGRYLLFGVVFFCLVLMGISYITGFDGGPLKTVTGFMFVPIERGLSQAGAGMRSWTENLDSLKATQELNSELQAQIDELIQENNKLQEERYELSELRELYDLDETYGNYEKIAARVIGKDAGNWYSTFLIDKGSADGIAVDMNVMAGSGLVGIVTKVGTNWAQVRSIIDDYSYISATVLSTSDSCFVAGDLTLMNDGVIRITDLKATNEEMSIGDKVLTSHISDKYQPGILIGYINELTLDSNNLTYSGTITPAVNFEYLHTVLVITDLKKTAD